MKRFAIYVSIFITEQQKEKNKETGEKSTVIEI